MPRRSPLLLSLEDAVRVLSPPLLQVLLSRFHMEGSRDGIRLELALGDRTPAITSREGKTAARPAGADPAALVAACQERIDAVVAGSAPAAYDHDDPALPFRHANGGALPLVRLEGRQYVVLFYRDIFPRGWNIANGASDAVEELLEPSAIIARELGEELLFHLPRERRLARAATISPLDAPWPAGTPGHDFWARRLGAGALAREIRLLHVHWLNGPDTVVVRALLAGTAFRCVTERCWLTVTARDQGLEVDRIATIELPDGAVPVDGELNGEVPVDRPIGLFDPADLGERLRAGADEFRPARLFHGGREVGPAELEDLVRTEMLPRLEAAGLRTPDESRDLRGERFGRDLCPVTRALLSRWRSAGS